MGTDGGAADNFRGLWASESPVALPGGHPSLPALPWGPRYFGQSAVPVGGKGSTVRTWKIPKVSESLGSERKGGAPRPLPRKQAGGRSGAGGQVCALAVDAFPGARFLSAPLSTVSWGRGRSCCAP